MRLVRELVFRTPVLTVASRVSLLRQTAFRRAETSSVDRPRESGGLDFARWCSSMRLVNAVKELVYPATPTPPPQLLRLSDVDQRLVQFSHFTLMFFHKPKSEKPSLQLLPPAALKTSMSKALTLFFPLAGRLKARQGSSPAGQVDVDCNDAGALFQDAEAQGTLEEVGGFCPKPEFQQLLVPSLLDDPALPAEQVPLLGVRVTRFLCGGAVMAVSIHHGLCDGFAAAEFLNTWSALALGKEVQQLPKPHHDRSALGARHPPRVTCAHPEFTLVPPTFPQDWAPGPVSGMILDLQASHVAALKQRAAAQGGASFTAFEAVMGLLWRSVMRARGLDPASRVWLAVAVDVRKKMRLPPGYSGNAIFGYMAETTTGELLGGGLSDAADCVHQAVGKVTDEHAKSCLDLFALQESPLSVYDTHFALRDTALVVTSVKNLPLYDAHFGMGRPDFVGIPSPAIDGLVVLLPGHRKEGGMNALIWLRDDVLVKLKSDPELQDFPALGYLKL